MILKKIGLIACTVFLCNMAIGQQIEIKKYFDSSWKPVAKDTAWYYTIFKKANKGYRATSYIKETALLYSDGFFSDTIFTKPIGFLNKYYPNGVIQDSSVVNESGNQIAGYSFYENGKLQSSMIENPVTKKIAHKGYDKAGNEIEGYIYFRDAEFPGGAEAFRQFLSKNIKSKVPVKKGAPAGIYTVMIRFVLDEKGNVIEIEPETNLGFGMEEEVMRVIKKSPRWKPLIYLNTLRKAYRRQPLTFEVSEK